MTRRPPAPDVAIVGGGIIGAASATFLAAAGVRVTLYERTEIAVAASGRNSTFVMSTSAATRPPAGTPA